MDPMQAQGLEALAQQDQPMEEQPMMAANGGLMNINLPDDYYDEDSYAHGGIAHFQDAGSVQQDFNDRIKKNRDNAVFRQQKSEYDKKREDLIAQIIKEAGPTSLFTPGFDSVNPYGQEEENVKEKLSGLTNFELEEMVKPEGKKSTLPSSNLFMTDATELEDQVYTDTNSWAPTKNLGNRRAPTAPATPTAPTEASYKEDPISPYDFSLPPQFMGTQPSSMGNRSSNPYAGIEALINSNSTAQPEQTAPTKARSLKDYMDESSGLMPKSPVEEEYKAQMLADQNKSNPNRDMWETAGKVFARMTEAANTPGATVFGSAATGLAGLSEDMAATRKGNEQRQKQNLIDRYNIEKAEREEARSNIRDALDRQGNDEEIARAEARFKQEDLIKYQEMMMQLGIRKVDNEAANYRAEIQEQGATSRANQTNAYNWFNNRMSATEEAKERQRDRIYESGKTEDDQLFQLDKLDKQFGFDMQNVRLAAELAKEGGDPDRYLEAIKTVMQNDTDYLELNAKDPVAAHRLLKSKAEELANEGRQSGSRGTSSEEGTLPKYQIERLN